jgi:hypothetical protein
MNKQSQTESSRSTSRRTSSQSPAKQVKLAAPPVYHPQPTPRVLQKKEPFDNPSAGKARSATTGRAKVATQVVQPKARVVAPPAQNSHPKTVRPLPAQPQSRTVQRMLVGVRASVTRAGGSVRPRFYSSSSGGGKDPNKPPFKAPVKGHYIDYYRVLRDMRNPQLYKTPSGLWVFMHQVNKGGEAEIMTGGFLKGSEGRFGGVYARAKSANESDVPQRSGSPLIFFNTLQRPENDQEGMLTGIQWADVLRFFAAFCIHPDGEVSVYGPGFDFHKEGQQKD